MPDSVLDSIFKAYDVRGVYPGEVNEDAARAIGAAFVVYLRADRKSTRLNSSHTR